MVLFNTTDSIISRLGTSEYSEATANAATISLINTLLTTTDNKTFEIRHNTQLVKVTNGLGVGHVSAPYAYNVYSQCKITKVR